ncbi:hypothetical protein N7462_008546 [Penicillium macrosclerotiorum]|uniref:uncharacterized protein n=1 Tax=Penicillium macrosclerotiorum TaxID=303699 RepID=UPI0025494605|nr:uncharacterized protein N7462_008546 [Penicillium macrosclerotiorum]KAJ5675649.1 hypothetical protein N7462_008546 [Penicillium macrosclerotiorum]
MADKKLALILEEDGGFPNDAIFATNLIPVAREIKRAVFHDPAKDLNVTYDQFLTDVVYMRRQLKAHLSSFIDPQNGSMFAEPVLICTLAPANYEFAVAAFAILALGATIVPLPTNTTPALVFHHLRKSPVKYILAGSDFLDQANEFQAYANQNFLPAVQVESITVHNECPDSLWDLPHVNIAENLTFPESRPGIVFFSSGSTGVPKGVIHNRGFFYNMPRLAPDESFLVHRPASWLAGTMPLASAVLGGARAEIIDPASPPEAFWERLRTDKITTLMTTVVLWEKMARYYKHNLEAHPDRAQYVAGLHNLRTALIGGSVPVPSLLKFYSEEFNLQLGIAYGSTETGKIVSLLPPGVQVEENRCIGKPLSPQNPFKLSDGDRGELLIGGITTLLGYINDEAAIRAVLDDEGYLRTGDLVHKTGEFYFFDGRASVDFIKTPGGPVPVVQLEEAVQTLEYFKETYVVPVEDQVVGRRVGVLARPRDASVSLAKLREDLASLVAPHMLPSAFRILETDDTIPLTYTDKVSKKDIMKKFFLCDSEGKLPSVVELMDLEFQ